MIIGFAGVSGSGKDTAGEHLVENYGYTRIALGDKVKECLAALLGVDIEFINRNKSNDKDLLGLYRQSGFNMGGAISNHVVKPITIRHALQRMGTEVGRNILGENTWIDLALGSLQLERPDVKVVVTDIRFQNEVDCINRWSGYVWRIHRAEAGIAGNHASEEVSALEHISVEIQNNDSLQTFYAALDESIELDLGAVKLANS